MPFGTKTAHRWSDPDEEGIAVCMNCPCLRKTEGPGKRRYKPRKTSDWLREVPTCTTSKFNVPKEVNR